MRRLVNGTVAALFVTIILLPLAGNITGRGLVDAEAENRTLAAWPTLDGTWRSIEAFPDSFTLWWEDHFAFRSTLIRWYGVTRAFWLRTSPSPMVVRGRDGWLFYTEDGGLPDMANAAPLPPGQVANWRTTIVKARDWCRRHGIAYVFASPPDKHTIYPEYLPPTVRKVHPASRLDQLIEATRDTGVVVDVRPAMFAAKSRERLYHVTDTHWNDRGAYVAYREIIDAVRLQVPSVPPPRPRSDFDERTRTLDGRDMAAVIGLKRVTQEIDLRLLPKIGRGYKVLEPAGGYATGGDGRIVTEIPGSPLPRAVIFRDSFTSALAPFLSEHFSRAVYLWQNDFDAQAVLDEHPDVVIQEIVGRHLYQFIPSPELIPDVKSN